MRSTILIIGLLLVLAPERITVVCTTTVLGSLVKEVGNDRVDVISLVQPGMCPSHFDVKPSHIEEVGHASLVLYHGVEPWLEDLVKASGDKAEKVKIEGPWNTPELAAKRVEEVRDALMKVDPENGEYYRENAEKVIAEIYRVGDEIEKDSEALGLGSVPVLCMEWMKFPVEWMGFTVVGTYAPPETLSVRDVKDLMEKGKDRKVALVIDNLQSGTEVGAEIAAEIGANHVVLTNFPGAVPGTETLAQMIGYNAEQLFSGVEEYREEIRNAEIRSELENERSKREIFEIAALVLAFACIIEGILLVRK